MSRAIKKIPYKFVHVYWIDIQSDSSWRSVEDVKEDTLPRCLSTGFLIDEDDEVDLGQGWEGETGTFVTMDVVIEQGVLVHGYWTLDSDGENCTDHTDEYDDAVITVKPISGGDSFTLGWHDKLGSEVNTNSRNCPGYEDWYIAEGDVVKLFMVQEDGELSMLSVGQP